MRFGMGNVAGCVQWKTDSESELGKVLIKERPGICTCGREKREQDGQSSGELSDWNDISDFFQVGLEQSDLCPPVLISY